MPKKQDYYEDFLKITEFKEKLSQQQKNKKLRSLIVWLLAYLIVLVIFFSYFNKIFSVLVNKRESNTNLSLKIAELKSEVDDISKIISSNKNPSFNYLDSRLLAVEQKNSYLYDTILSNPDNAITPKILREEQENIKEKVQDLKDRVDTTNNWLAGIVGAILLAILAFFAKNIWNTIFPKKDSVKE